jgi:ketosteroid isomerase-like protein
MKRSGVLILLALFATSTISIASPAQATNNSEDDIRNTLSDFTHAFDNLEWDRFRLSFSDDATVFYPREFPHRADGRKEFEKFFEKVFEHIRAGRTHGPYMDIQPKELKLQIVGDVAVATFHLDDRPGFLNRRTIVLQKRDGQWKIIHLHASEVSTLAP